MDAGDVVAQHHQRNHPPRLPDNAQLTVIRNQQMSEEPHSASRSRSVTSGVSTPISADVHAEPSSLLPTDVNSVTQSRLPSSIKFMSGNDNGDPSQLNFYPPVVRDIIERTKQFSHCNLASINLFPLRPHFKTKASEYIVK